MEQHICSVSPFIIALFSVKDWLVNFFPSYLRSLYVVQLGTAHIGNNIPARGLQGEVKFKEVTLLSILTRNIYSNFSPEFLSMFEYNSEKKTVCCRPFKQGHFVRACMEKMRNHKYKENGARNIHSNYNQMRVYAECSPNQ